MSVLQQRCMCLNQHSTYTYRLTQAKHWQFSTGLSVFVQLAQIAGCISGNTPLITTNQAGWFILWARASAVPVRFCSVICRFHSEEPPGIASVDGEGQVMAQVMLSQQQLLAAGDTRQHHAGQASGTTTAAQRPLPAALAALAAARAAAIRCTPREQPKTLLCEAVPELPAVACEVSAALGYYPTDQGLHMGQLAVHLQQPRTANLVCMKLLNCEDVKPAFNRERGGCNIDMQLVMLRGHELGVLPAGLAVVAAGAGQRS